MCRHLSGPSQVPRDTGTVGNVPTIGNDRFLRALCEGTCWDSHATIRGRLLEHGLRKWENLHARDAMMGHGNGDSCHEARRDAPKPGVKETALEPSLVLFKGVVELRGLGNTPLGVGLAVTRLVTVSGASVRTLVSTAIAEPHLQMCGVFPSFKMRTTWGTRKVDGTTFVISFEPQHSSINDSPYTTRLCDGAACLGRADQLEGKITSRRINDSFNDPMIEFNAPANTCLELESKCPLQVPPKNPPTDLVVLQGPTLAKMIRWRLALDGPYRIADEDKLLHSVWLTSFESIS